ncbi:MAG: glycosyltransferase family 4 protein [Nitrospiraceae bacterium]
MMLKPFAGQNSNVIRIVHIISNLEIGGAEFMLTKLVSSMDRHRFLNVVISLTDRGQLADAIESSGIPVYCLGMVRGRPDVPSLPRLVRLLKDMKPTLVQSWLYHADLISLLATRFVRPTQLVWNVRCSDMDLKYYPFQTRCVRRILAWNSAAPAAVVVNSEAGRRQHQRLGYQPRRWAFIPNGFDTDRFRPDRVAAKKLRDELGLSCYTMLIALIARFDAMKDHTTFLAAAARIASERPQVHFLLAGQYTERLIPRVAELGLRSRIHILGLRHDVDHLLAGVDLACLSSAFGEGFPNVLGEAMACGVPCIVTDVGDAGIIVGSTGLVVPPRNPDALARALLDMIDRDDAARTELGGAARTRIQARYSLPRVIEQYQNLYAEIATPFNPSANSSDPTP